MEKKKTEEKSVDQLLDDVLAKVEKQYGKGAIMRLGERNSTKIDAISTGSLTTFTLGVQELQVLQDPQGFGATGRLTTVLQVVHGITGAG